MPVLYHVLSRNVRKARLDAGFSQAKIAEQLGISVLHYGRIERMQRKPSLEQIEHIAEVLGCPVFQLLRGCFLEEMDTVFSEREPSVFAGKMVAMMEGCSEEELELFYEMMRLIVYRKIALK